MASQLPHDKVKAIVELIRNTDVPNKAVYFENKYSNFKKKYPKLYDMACNQPNMDMKNFEFMLSMLSKMQSSDISQYDASAEVGQFMYDKYIHENIKDLPPTKK
jgi:hypothetical protein